MSSWQMAFVRVHRWMQGLVLSVRRTLLKNQTDNILKKSIDIFRKNQTLFYDIPEWLKTNQHVSPSWMNSLSKPLANFLKKSNRTQTEISGSNPVCVKVQHSTAL